MINRAFIVALFILIQFNLHSLSAQESFLFQGEITGNNINVRSDSTVSSEIICTVDKGDLVGVVSELYEWQKIRLPKNAPSFVKKSLVMLIGDKTAKALKDNVNIRLHPNESSPILGRVNKDEAIIVLGERGGWYRIEPVNNSYGWIHKKFVNKVVPMINKTEDAKLIKEEIVVKVKEDKDTEGITLEGVILPYGKVFKRKATHKLITKDDKVYLLKGNKETLNNLNYHKVKIIGKLITADKQKYPVVEIDKAQILD